MPNAYLAFRARYSQTPKPLRILIAEDDKDLLELYQLHVETMGHEVVGAATNGQELVDLSCASKPDLIIADIDMPELSGIQAADQIATTCAVPVILVSGHYDASILKRAGLASVMSYLIKPVSGDALKAAIAIAVRRFAEYKAVVDEAATVRQALHDRKIIERAKGLLMQHSDLTEPEAFKRLQEMAWNKNQKLVKVAETVIMATEVIHCADVKLPANIAKSFTARRKSRT